MKSSLWSWKVLLLAFGAFALMVGLAWLPAGPADAGVECTDCLGPEQQANGSGGPASTCGEAANESRQDAFQKAATGGCIPCDTFELSECFGTPGAWQAVTNLTYKCMYCEFEPEDPPLP